MRIPCAGRSVDELLDEIGELRRGDIDWRRGRAFSLVYNADDPELERLLHTVGANFLHENALNPFRYQTLLKMESEVVAMAVALFGAGCGSMSSGGTESIFLAVQTARDHARSRGIRHPQVVCTDTAHPAFAKACHYLDMEMVRLEHGPDGRAVPERYAEAAGDRTALFVASSPCYPFGVIDPVAEIARLAAERNLLCHVDACLGGWILPWCERLGEKVPPWDFRVPGVTSLSADLHKYGYSFKGASVLLYRDHDLLQRQVFLYDSWPGGIYASSSAAGTRSGAPIAGAWSTINHLGEEGYLRLTSRVLFATTRLRSGIAAIHGLRIHFNPDLSLFEFGSDTVDMNAVCDVMDSRGWNLDRQQGGLHLIVSPGHDRVAEAFLNDLAGAVCGRGHARGGSHTYGGIAI